MSHLDDGWERRQRKREDQQTAQGCAMLFVFLFRQKWFWIVVVILFFIRFWSSIFDL